jgi:hypothetical protein
MRRTSESPNATRRTSAKPYEPPRLEKLGKVTEDTKGGALAVISDAVDFLIT